MLVGISMTLLSYQHLWNAVMLCCCLLTSCLCAKYFTSTVQVLFICSRYLSLQLTVSITVFDLSTRIFLFLWHFHHLNYRLYETIQWLPYPRKTYFLVTNWYQLGDTWNFLLKHRKILYCVSDSTCIKVLHKPSLMNAIPPHKVYTRPLNLYKHTKYTSTSKINIALHSSLWFVWLSLQYRNFNSTVQAASVFGTVVFHWLAIVESGTAVILPVSFCLLYSHILTLQVSIYQS